MGCCVAVNCTNSRAKGFRMYRFPRDPKRKRIWEEKTKRGGGWRPNANSELCEAHFDDSQFESRRADGWRKLKPNAVPTIFAHTVVRVTRKPPKSRLQPQGITVPLREEARTAESTSTSQAGQTSTEAIGGAPAVSLMKEGCMPLQRRELTTQQTTSGLSSIEHFPVGSIHTSDDSSVVQILVRPCFPHAVSDMAVPEKECTMQDTNTPDAVQDLSTCSLELEAPDSPSQVETLEYSLNSSAALYPEAPASPLMVDTLDSCSPTCHPEDTDKQACDSSSQPMHGDTANISYVLHKQMCDHLSVLSRDTTMPIDVMDTNAPDAVQDLSTCSIELEPPDSPPQLETLDSSQNNSAALYPEAPDSPLTDSPRQYETLDSPLNHFPTLHPEPPDSPQLIETLDSCSATSHPEAAAGDQQRLLQRIAELERQCRREKKKVRKLQEEKQKFSENLSSVFNEDQLASLSRSSNRGSKWSEETIKKALQLHFSCGSTGYSNLLDQKLPLPSSRTLRRRVEAIKFNLGILDEMFSLLESKVPGLNVQQKCCVLMIDEMAIQQRMEYDPSTSSVRGYTTLPVPGKPSNTPATHGLVFMLCGMSTRWK
ncbi:uncharacterized protein LOC135371568 isoform X2 [Ornithodoros turicata]|uniref:uncharacterized protein LOC135371568 isoform X2 n=1 Tax=Ornithodoros turicata TaxID=34597 RepID=UPI003139D072